MQPRHFLRDFPPRKRRVAQMHRAIYNILLPRTGWHLIPFPPPQRVYGRTLRHNQIFSDGWFTKFSYPWCSAGALRALELRYNSTPPRYFVCCIWHHVTLHFQFWLAEREGKWANSCWSFSSCWRNCIEDEKHFLIVLNTIVLDRNFIFIFLKMMQPSSI